METIDYLTFTSILLYTLVLLLLGLIIVRTPGEKLFYFFGILSIYLYSGIGAAFDGVPTMYIFMYLIFLFCFAFSFLLMVMTEEKGKEIYYFTRIQHVTELQKEWTIFLVIYTLFNMVPLVYPDFKLDRLINPPKPSLLDNFFERFSGEATSPIIAIHVKIKSMLFPFFLIALYVLRKNKGKCIFFLFMYLYTIFCADAYIGRFIIVQFFLIFFLILIFTKEISMKKALIIGTIFSLVFLVFYNIYGQVRLGVSWDEAAQKEESMGESWEKFVRDEFYYSQYADYLINGGQQVDFTTYLLWIVTLPIPKEIIGRSVSLEMNTDITTYLTGQYVGKGGTYVHLVSVVGESIYIYGNYFFWVHAVLIGTIFGFLCKLTRKTPALTGISVYYAILLLTIGRGGIASVLPVVVNYFLPLYIWMFATKISHRKELTTVE